MNVQSDYELYKSRFPRSYSNITIIIFYLQDKVRLNQLLDIEDIKMLLKVNISSKDFLGGEVNWEPTSYTNRGKTKSDRLKIFEAYCMIIDNYRKQLRKRAIKKLINKDYIETLWY